MEDFIFMKLSQDEKLIVEELRNLANGDLNVNDVNSFLKSLMLLMRMVLKIHSLDMMENNIQKK